MEEKNILMLANNYARIHDLVRLAKGISTRGPKFNFIFVLPLILFNYKEYIENENFQVILLDKDLSENKVQRVSIKNKIISYGFLFKMLTSIRDTSLGEIASYLRYKIIFKRIYERSKEILNVLSPISIFTTGDRESIRGTAFLKAAKDKKIAIIIPYLTVSGADAPAFLRRERKIYRLSFLSPIITKYVFNKFTDQVYNSKWGDMIFYRPSEILTLNRFNALSENPWFMGLGLSDIVIVDNKYTYQNYRKFGIPENKLRIYGDLSFDDLYNSYLNKDKIKQNIINEYLLDPEKKIVIIALPQFAEHNIMSWDLHWKEINFILSEVSKVFNNILISLHPKMEREEYMFLENKYSCKILQERLYRVLPIADMFISVNSSTIGWAVLCGIKTATFEFYDLPIVFEGLSSIKRIYEKDEIEHKIKEYLEQEVDFSADWNILSKNEVFDGKVIDRNFKLLKNLCLG